MSLAGTLPVSESWSEKEIEEQKPVSNYIRDILKNYSEMLEESETYDHISGNIKHLRTDFKTKIQPEDLDTHSGITSYSCCLRDTKRIL
jgi:isochorismate synthase